MEALLEQVQSLSSEDRLLFFQKMAEGLTVGELVKLVPQLEEAWDVEAKPAVPDWMKGGGQQQVEEEVEQTEFDVVVTGAGDKRIQVVKGVRQATGMQLKDANELLKQLPATIAQKLSKDKAEELKKVVEEAGGTAELK